VEALAEPFAAIVLEAGFVLGRMLLMGLEW
jgi:hypothetical protein